MTQRLGRWVLGGWMVFVAGGCGVAPEEETPAPPVSDEGHVEALSRNCQTSCAAQKIVTGAACQNFAGFGDSTYVGGCAKACKSARRLAETKAATVGCEVTLCTDSCS